MKFALIHYDVNRIANEPGNKTVMKHFGHMPNIQLLYVAAILEQLDVELQYYDIVGMHLSIGEIEERLKIWQPDIIALSVFTSHLHNAKSYAERFKTLLPQTKIMVGGVHMWIYPTQTLEFHSCFDYGVVGEAEMVLPEFIQRWKSNESFKGLRGLVWRDGDMVKYAGPPDLNTKLDDVPFPARHLVPNEVYFNFISSYQNYTVANTSRGCPYGCIFCEAARSKWRARSAANIVAEFEECYEKFAIQEIDIFDSSFTVNKKRVLEMCQLLIDKGLNKKMVWDVRSRVDTVDEEMLDALKEAGCYRIFYGIESANPDILLNLRKEIDLARIEHIIKKTDKVGISAFGYFLIGSPGETTNTARQTIDFAKKLPLDFAIFNVLTAFPDTELYKKYYLPFTQHDFWDDHIRRPEPIENLMGRPWTKIIDDELKSIAHRAMLEYYLRPLQIYRALRSVKSTSQMYRYLTAGLDMVISYWIGN